MEGMRPASAQFTAASDKGLCEGHNQASDEWHARPTLPVAWCFRALFWF